MKAQASELSALLDGELEEHEVRAAVTAAVKQDLLREDWQIYALIGDSLRGERPDSSDMTAAVIARVREEPQVLAPRNLVGRRPHHPLLALAASLAGVAVVGWLALAGSASQQVDVPGRLAAASPAPTFVRLQDNMRAKPPKQAQDVPVARGELNEYLLAHQLQAGTFRPGDTTRQVRSVAMVGVAEHP